MLNAFQSLIAGNGLARPNRYRISITGNGPSAAGGYGADLYMMCDSISFPGQNMVSSSDTLRFGPLRELINGVSYGPINASFLCSADMREKRFFERWQEQTMDLTTWEPKYYNDYIGGMKIFQLDRDNRATYVVELFEVYPKTITEQALANASNDSFQTISVELEYHHWKYSQERTPHTGGPPGRQKSSVSDGVASGGSISSGSISEGMPGHSTVATGSVTAGHTDPGTVRFSAAFTAGGETASTGNVTVKKGIITNPPPGSKASFGGAQGGADSNR